ncbi:transposase [Streptomyces sp. NPDC015131]|uniref:transposase n=1 Tax=Streptomyces sp. NPDC015131 TaxID=3364941 RepID=UPI0036FCDD67
MGVMSLRPEEWPEIPEATARVARAAAGRREAPLGMQVRDQLGALFADAEFAEAFGRRGRRGWSPGRLAKVTVLQMAENLTDRAAAWRVRFDLSWKYCLGLELEDVGFDASVLSEFRTRVVDHGLEERVLDLLVAALKEKEKGLVKTGGKQRTDSTHVLAAVRELNRLELAGEAMRAALEALPAAAPHGVDRRWRSVSGPGAAGGGSMRPGARPIPRPSGTSSPWTTAATRWPSCGRPTIRPRHSGYGSCPQYRYCDRSPS